MELIAKKENILEDIRRRKSAYKAYTNVDDAVLNIQNFKKYTVSKYMISKLTEIENAIKNEKLIEREMLENYIISMLNFNIIFICRTENANLDCAKKLVKELSRFISHWFKFEKTPYFELIYKLI